MNKPSPQKKSRSLFQAKRVVIKLPLVVVLVALVGTLVIAPFFITLYNFGWYEEQYAQHGTFDKIGGDNALLATYNLFSFFKCTEKENQPCGESLHVTYTHHNETFAFTEKEVDHLQDVKTRLLLLTWLLIFFLLVMVFYLTFLGVVYKRRKKFPVFWSLVFKLLFRAGLYLGIGTLVLALLLLAFESAFHVFHLVVFPQGNFAFPSDSLIKILFPNAFFANFAKNMATLMVGEALAAMVIGVIGRLSLGKKMQPPKKMAFSK